MSVSFLNTFGINLRLALAKRNVYILLIMVNMYQLVKEGLVRLAGWLVALVSRL
jgi:hypothetical protein